MSSIKFRYGHAMPKARVGMLLVGIKFDRDVLGKLFFAPS
jgi:hypothetical protein